MNRRYGTVRALVIAVFLLGTGIANAHNFWLESHPFRPGVDERVSVSVHVGIDMRGNSLPNIPNWYTDFSYFDSTGRHPVSGDLGSDPAGHIWVRRPGIVVVGYESTGETAEMGAEFFRTYLVDEGLEKIIRRRESDGTADRDVREIFTRHVKTIILVDGGIESDTYARRFGYTLELTPLDNPYRLKPGDELRVELRFRGEPLPGARVAALRKEDPEVSHGVRTDADGRAIVRLPAAGTWQIKAVESVPHDGDAADYESFWASMTFELAE